MIEKKAKIIQSIRFDIQKQMSVFESNFSDDMLCKRKVDERGVQDIACFS